MSSMRTFVLELGERLNPGKPEESWKSEGFYGGYTDKGPIITPTSETAYHFPDREHAENVLNGDERFKGARIVAGSITL